MMVAARGQVSGRARSARLGLLVFFAVLLPLSAVGYWLYAKGSVVLIFAPAAASIVARLLLREGFADVSFRLGGRKTLYAVLLAVAFPLAVASLAWGSAWLLGLAEFGPEGNFALSLLLSATLITVVQATGFWGEELGWRGYMLTRLFEAGVPRPLLTSGLIWGAWHVPLIVGGVYGPGGGPSVALAVAVFMVVATSYACFLGWLRLGTGAIWAPVAGHAAWNAITQEAFGAATGGANALLWTGESGILVALVLVPAVFLVPRLWKLPEYLKTPKEPLEPGRSRAS